MKVTVNKNNDEEKEEKSTFGGEVGGGIGCLFIALALIILFNGPTIIALVAEMIRCHK